MREGSSPTAHVAAKLVSSPGDLYNFGNILALTAGLAVAVANTLRVDWTWSTLERSTYSYLVGSPSALLITVSTIVFCRSGRCYARAYSETAARVPHVRQLRRGDWYSGAGAIALGTGMYCLDHSLLAILSGLLHCGGKFGSALTADWRTRGRIDASIVRDLFRSAVLISRTPGLVVALLSLTTALSTGVAFDAVMPLTMLICYLVWGMADILLLVKDRPRRAGSATSRSDVSHHGGAIIGYRPASEHQRGSGS